MVWAEKIKFSLTLLGLWTSGRQSSNGTLAFLVVMDQLINGNFELFIVYKYKLNESIHQPISVIIIGILYTCDLVEVNEKLDL